MDRVKYLFNTTLKKHANKIVYIQTNENTNEFDDEEHNKLQQLINKPFGEWKNFIQNHLQDSS